MPTEFSHLDEQQRPRMVDVSDKAVTVRRARARCDIALPPELAVLLREGKGEIQSAKGPVFHTAIIAGTQAAKRTSELIPFCHQIPLESCKIAIDAHGESALRIEASVRATHKTGVEMEALTAVSVAALTVYDMCKALSPAIVLGPIRLVEKTGGKSDFHLA
jgi:cyclic pyranopterin phosphate synthase